MKKITAMLLCLLLLWMTGCGGAGGDGISRTQAGTGGGDAAEQASPVENKDIQLSALLPTNQQAFGTLLENMASAEGYTLKIQMTGQGQSYTDALLEALGSDSPPDLYWLDGNWQAWQLMEESRPMARLDGGEFSALGTALASLVPAAPRLLDEEAVYGLPVGYYAQGTLVNIEALEDLLGAADRQVLLRDLVAADYTQWQVLVATLSSFLVRPQRMEVSLGENRYYTPGNYRPEAAKTLRGVYAMATGESRSYFQNTLGAVYGATFGSAEDYRDATPEQRAAVLAAPLGAGLDLLYLETGFMTQEEEQYARGEAFGETPRLTIQKSRELFAGGTALFLQGDSRLGLALERENPELQGKLALVPTKLPVRVQLGGGEELKMYQQYAIAVEGYLCVGEESLNKSHLEAILLRLFGSKEGQRAIEEELGLLAFSDIYPATLLNSQLAEALALGDFYQVPIEASELDAQQWRMGEWVLQELMLKTEWDEADEEAFVTAALGYMNLPVAEPAEEEAAVPEQTGDAPPESAPQTTDLPISAPPEAA